MIPTASLAGTEVSIEEIRSASPFPGHYPPSIHAPLISSPEPDPNPNGMYVQYKPLSLVIGY